MKNLASLSKNQGFRFAIIGGLNTILDIVILVILTNFGVNKIIANIFSTGITFLNSFGLNKKYTFKSELKSKKQLAKEMVLFTIVTLFGLWVVQGFIIFLLSPIAKNLINNDGIATILAKIPATAVSMIWNFILYKKVVFKK
ncbi:MAG: GtrA family protein [bacterium]|nr:GtrA family protein [bacterium]